MEQFGEKIRVSKQTISNIENNNRSPSDQMTLSICREFNVNEDWLKNGTGEMYNPEPTSPLGDLINVYNLDEDERLLVEKFINMTLNQRHLFVYHIKEIMKFMEVII